MKIGGINMNGADNEMRTDFVKSADGTVISYKVIGKGPGLVIVHGGFRASQHYIKLAT